MAAARAPVASAIWRVAANRRHAPASSTADRTVKPLATHSQLQSRFPSEHVTSSPSSCSRHNVRLPRRSAVTTVAAATAAAGERAAASKSESVRSSRDRKKNGWRAAAALASPRQPRAPAVDAAATIIRVSISAHGGELTATARRRAHLRVGRLSAAHASERRTGRRRRWRARLLAPLSDATDEPSPGRRDARGMSTLQRCFTRRHRDIVVQQSSLRRARLSTLVVARRRRRAGDQPTPHLVAANVACGIAHSSQHTTRCRADQLASTSRSSFVALTKQATTAIASSSRSHVRPSRPFEFVVDCSTRPTIDNNHGHDDRHT